jgi:V/A-type H+/Na+-transporting ATPase subunit D
MPKIKLTKSELKSQRDSLKQFERFLPTLQLKKQQLQLETRLSQRRVEKNKVKEENAKKEIVSWISMFGIDAELEKIISYISIDKVDYIFTNIAGVKIPIYNKTIFNIQKYDLFIEDSWIDDGIEILKNILEIRIERDILKEQFIRLNKELQTTTQRVNLFEKVKIPECKENIRYIQIYLGDQQTAAVGRSKIAKKKLAEVA